MKENNVLMKYLIAYYATTGKMQKTVIVCALVGVVTRCNFSFLFFLET